MIPNMKQGERRVSNTDRARATMRRRRGQSNIPSPVNLIPRDLIDACWRTIFLISSRSSQQSLHFPVLLLRLLLNRSGSGNQICLLSSPSCPEDPIWLFVSEEQGCDLWIQKGDCGASDAFPLPVDLETCTQVPIDYKGSVWSFRAVCGG